MEYLTTISGEAVSLGQHISHWRRQKGLTIGQLALRSGVSKASLSRWEAGLVQPRIRELEAVLDVFKLPEAIRVAAFSCLGAPRAARRIASSTSTDSPVRTPSNCPFGELPRTGELLRAMRVRTGFTQMEVATLVGVQQSSVTRWETSVESPTLEHLQALCTLLEATIEEREALARGPVIQPTLGVRVNLEEVSWRHQQLLENAVFGAQNDADLAFFQLEADLWPSAQKSVPSLALLFHVYSSHARFLTWRRRYAESDRYISILKRLDVINALSQNGFFVPAQTGFILDAEPSMRLGRASTQAAVQTLIQYEPLFTELEHRAWLLMTIAEGLATLGRREEALVFASRGTATPLADGQSRIEDPATLLFRASIYNRLGAPASALTNLGRITTQILTPAQRISQEVIRATALNALSDRPAASDAVRRGYTLLETYGTIGYKASLDTIAAVL